MMSQLQKPYYAEGPLTNKDNDYDNQYHLTDQKSDFPSMYRQSETLPLHHMSGSTSYGRKRVGTLDVTYPVEQETLLNPGPVKFTSCWESQPVANDDLNFKSALIQSEVDSSPPKDKYNLVFYILLLHGLGILVPWNAFMTAKSYFEDYKLNVNSSTGAVENYREHFISFVGIASQVPNVICNALNLFIQFGGSTLTYRIVGSIFSVIIILIITVVLAMVDSSTWPGMFFYATMACIVLINMANGIYQNSLYGLAAKLPMKYSMAIVIGNNICGVFTAVLLIFSIAVSPNARTAAIYYFISALFVLLICMDTYFALPLLRFYRYYEKLSEKAASDEMRQGCPPFWKVFKKIWPQCFNVFFVFFVTLSLYPAVHANIKRLDPDLIIPEKYFAPVTCFLCFNVFAMFGSFLPSWVTWPGPRYLWIPVISRFLIVPYFMLCNYKPDKRVIPVLINNDWAYVAMGSILGITSFH